MAQTQHDFLYAIAVPFGLGKLLSAYDKEGGNVDTIHNARAGVYATEEAKKAYKEHVEIYNKKGKKEKKKDVNDPVYSDNNYTDNNLEVSGRTRKQDKLQDSYSDKILGRKDKSNLDHVIPIKMTYLDAGRLLADIETKDLANISENLTPTSESVNKSKNAKSPEKFVSYLEKNTLQRRAKIQKLNDKPILTHKERNELNKLNTLESVDTEKVIEIGIKAQEAQDKRVNDEYYSSKKFKINRLETSAIEGVKMGAQQAFGLLLIELFTNSFHEIKAAFDVNDHLPIANFD